MCVRVFVFVYALAHTTLSYSCASASDAYQGFGLQLGCCEKSLISVAVFESGMIYHAVFMTN